MPMRPLSDFFEQDVPKDFYVSDRIRKQRMAKCEIKNPVSPGIWHENKNGHISVYPYSCALRAGASYNYLLVDGVRRLTGREMFRLQGFPDSFVMPRTYGVARHQAGNSLPVPVAQSVIKNVFLGFNAFTYQTIRANKGLAMQTFEEGVLYGT